MYSITLCDSDGKIVDRFKCANLQRLLRCLHRAKRKGCSVAITYPLGLEQDRLLVVERERLDDIIAFVKGFLGRERLATPRDTGDLPQCPRLP